MLVADLTTFFSHTVQVIRDLKNYTVTVAKMLHIGHLNLSNYPDILFSLSEMT